MSNRRSDPWGT